MLFEDTDLWGFIIAPQDTSTEPFQPGIRSPPPQPYLEVDTAAFGVKFYREHRGPFPRVHAHPPVHA